MTNETRARVAPAAEPAQLTEQISVLVDEETRAFLLGCKLADDARSEGAVARALIEDSIAAFTATESGRAEWRRRVKLGREELERRRA